MKTKALVLVLVVVFLLACGVSSEQLTATAVAAEAQTQTAAPTLTATKTPAPTSTPKPTSTPLPTRTPEPTPAQVGETVKHGSLEITLVEVATDSHIVPSGGYYWYSDPGQTFVDIAVLVRNTKTTPARVAINYIGITQENGESWYPNFYGSKTVEIGRKFNPMASLKFEETSGTEMVSFEQDTYLRLIWYIEDKQTVLFDINGSPQILIPVNMTTDL
jgi:hypothetical protein